MPELPEVETIRRQLEERVVGKAVARVEVLEPKMFVGDPRQLYGKKITGVERSAKVLRILFEDGVALWAHFKLNGQLFLELPGQALDRRFTRVIIEFTDGSRLLFNDSRKFAWMKLIQDHQAVAQTVIEPFKDNFTLKNFSEIISKSRKPIKVLLMDQAKIGGIGNIYANESLFVARIDPFRPANSLMPGEAKKLYGAIISVLEKAIECKGSSGKDEWYRQLDGKMGCYQDHFLVYQRDGQKCFGCGGEVRRQKQAGRGTFYCPKCQK